MQEERHYIAERKEDTEEVLLQYQLPDQTKQVKTVRLFQTQILHRPDLQHRKHSDPVAHINGSPYGLRHPKGGTG